MDGSYFNALENLNDSYKFIEDAINALQVNNEKKKYVKYGINPDVESYFVREQNKYELEGPKNLFDQDQLTEFYFKLCTEHPLIEYIEDPFAEGDLNGYNKVLKRFRENMPRVKIGVNKWFKSSLDLIKQVFIYFMIDTLEHTNNHN